ncbi:MAG: serine hydrolase [Xanthomonadales bacterium]|jgi:CubicO group peptidase (beta-lactamase class C family)|nr:serine hydrolase [Xanthomonadales bacterium]
MRLLPALIVLCGFPACTLATVPSDAEIATYAKSVFEQNCDTQAPGMALLLARGDEVLFRAACGQANLELGVPLAPEQVFRIGSVTKQFAAAAVLKLATEGKLKLSDPLTKFVPGYPKGEAVTVQMLLDHTSGIKSYTDVPGVMEGPIRHDLSTAQLIASFKDQPAEFAPGEGWKYNNSGYVLVGAVIEKVTGKPWHQYLQEAFFAPLQLTHTGYGDTAEGLIPGHVSGYTLKGERWAPAAFLSMTQPHAGGALVSTVDDLLVWNRALHGGRVIGKDSYARMITPAKGAESYGFGIEIGSLRGEQVLQHGGGIPGFSAFLMYLPDSELSAVVLYNADSGRPGMLGTGRIANQLAAYALGKPYPEKKAVPMDAEALKAYEGVYRIDADNARVLRVVDGKLSSQRSGGLAYALIPVGADTFLFDEGFSRMVFERDADGGVVAMRFFPEDEGEGLRVARSDEALPVARMAITLPPPALERLVGDYAFEGATLKVFLDDGSPRAQITGQPAFEIHPESATRFFLTVIDATLEFAPAEGAATQVTLKQGGREMVFQRMP